LIQVLTFQPNTRLLAFIALAATVLVAAVALTALAASVNSRTVPSRGQIKSLNVSVYWNSACTNTTTSIDWGVLTPGTKISNAVYVRNEGNVPLKLSMIAQNWNPTSAASYLNLTWDLEAQSLNATATRAATLTLSVAANTAGLTSFTFDIIIAGTE
jgi:hypothetical protein